MNFENSNIAMSEKIKVNNRLLRNGMDDYIADIVGSLESKQPSISSKYFYDSVGSDLFERITSLPEYYPTRTEISILKQYSSELLERSGANQIVELGSGDCSKISILFGSQLEQRLEDITYIPIDVSIAAIEQSAEQLIQHFPQIRVEGHILDFTRDLKSLETDYPALICFFGSTIGNFNPKDAGILLSSVASIMNTDDTLLVGFDMVKESKVLQAAYNDSEGVTGLFNKNILKVINSIIESDFNPEDFDHIALFNIEESRIEMHLEANSDLTINSPNFSKQLKFRKGERIHTENSYKFTNDSISNLACDSGLQVNNVYTDENKWFSLVEMGKGEG